MGNIIQEQAHCVSCSGPGTRWSPTPTPHPIQTPTLGDWSPPQPPTPTTRSLTARLRRLMHIQCMFHLHTVKRLSSPSHYLIIDLCMPPQPPTPTLGAGSSVPFNPPWQQACPGTRNLPTIWITQLISSLPWHILKLYENGEHTKKVLLLRSQPWHQAPMTIHEWHHRFQDNC